MSARSLVPPNPVMRCWTYVKKLSRACSPSLPMSIARLDLGRDDRGGCGLDGVARSCAVVDRLAPTPATVQLGERGRSRQAAGVGGEDAGCRSISTSVTGEPLRQVAGRQVARPPAREVGVHLRSDRVAGERRRRHRGSCLRRGPSSRSSSPRSGPSPRRAPGRTCSSR